ncbi:MAG: site-specific integrase [Clostridiales bacterium]|nr:site-specific integrase [Clostridiales bacterium]
MKYKDWLNEWLENTVKPTVKYRTYEKYSRIINRQVIPELGAHELNDLTATTLQTYTAKLSAKYSANTVNGIVAVIRSSLERACQIGLTDKQFADSIKRPKIIEKQVECFSVEEQKKIEAYIINSNKDKMFGIILCLYTGLRIGELLALKWTDIDFDKAFISITKACNDSWKNGKYVKQIDTPKTIMSKRLIPIPRQLLQSLKVIRKRSKSDMVVSSDSIEQISIRSYQRTFELVLKKLKIPHKGFHSLRHTFATRAIECGMDVKTLSEILGHKNSTITLNRYTHSLLEHKTMMMNKLGKLFG